MNDKTEDEWESVIACLVQFWRNQGCTEQQARENAAIELWRCFRPSPVRRAWICPDAEHAQ